MSLFPSYVLFLHWPFRPLTPFSHSPSPFISLSFPLVISSELWGLIKMCLRDVKKSSRFMRGCDSGMSIGTSGRKDGHLMKIRGKKGNEGPPARETAGSTLFSSSSFYNWEDRGTGSALGSSTGAILYTIHCLQTTYITHRIIWS